MGTAEHEEPRFFFILNKGAKSGFETILPFRTAWVISPPDFALAREKLSSEEIQQQMKELGVEMEIVPLI